MRLPADHRLQRITGYPGVCVGFVFRIQVGVTATIREIALGTHDLEPERTRTFIEQATGYFALYEE